MKIISSIAQMQSWSCRAHRQGKSIGFVPTMGCLHQGHLSLIRRSLKENDLTVVSIFVNPAQFGPGEDFKRYPRNFRRDSHLCRENGVDILFHPGVRAMYPDEYKTYVEVEGLSNVLCGVSRPGHFRGVSTVVLKLLQIVWPQRAYFGQKDAQQALVIRQMVKDLNLAVKIKILPIIRERDGLAMSSRNSYLDAGQRKEAIILYSALQTAVGMIKSGHRAPREIIARMREMISKTPGARIDYIKIVQSDSLKEASVIKGRLLIALAVYFGSTRLIDNLTIKV